MSYDLIVIGGGPAGYAGAIRAAQLGKKAICIERERPGGTCLNWGCIPTKALLESARLYREMTEQAEEFGLHAEGVTADWPAVVRRSRAVCDRLSTGIEFLFRKHNIDSLCGEASLSADRTVKVTTADGTEHRLHAPHILIATGARTRELPGMPINGRTIIGSRDALILPKLPASMLVIGSGAIGTEISYIYHSFGTKVTLLEAMPRILPLEDDEVCTAVERAFKKRGITCFTGARVESLCECPGGIRAVFTAKNSQKKEAEAEVCLIAAGVCPVVPQAEGLMLTERGFIAVNDRYETNLPGVCAVGDCIGGIMLAHVAYFEAVQAVDGMFVPGAQPKKAQHVPGCTFCRPQVASVGSRERDLREAGIAYKVGRFPFRAIGRAVAAGETEGFVKLLFGAEHGELLGAHIVGECATELIATPALGINAELTDEDLHAMIFAHPTLAEAIHEAALAADNLQIHA